MEDISNNSTAAVSEAVEEKTNEVVDTTVANEQAETPATEDIVLVENAEQVITTSEQPETNSVLIFVIAIVAAIIITFLIVRIIKSKKKAANNKGKKKSFKSNPNAVEIYVGNLSYEMGNSELRKEFEKFGIVTSARIITQHNSRKSKGYGFVEMPHRTEAEEAIRALNNKEIKGRKIHVNEARTNTRQTNR
ncbi:MAG: hypothetical protein J6V70_02645 [Kiritimatiellae bacterium]|nr:hypothetical protein [Kiritimatiellia bacterium]